MKVLSRRVPLAAALLIIVLATLVPMGPLPPRFYWRPEFSDVLVNLCLYLPLGLLLARAGASLWAVALLALLLSGSIELLQGTVITGRRGSPADVLANTMGALAGLGLYHALLRLRLAAPRRRSTALGTFSIVSVLAALPVLGWIGSAVLLRPVPSRSFPWYGQWAHVMPWTEPFRGTLISVSFARHRLQDAPSDSSLVLLAEAQKGALRLEVSLHSGGRTAGLTQLAGVADGHGSTIIGLEQLGDDLLLSWRSRGSAVGLRPPRAVFAGALRSAPGERVTIRARVAGPVASAVIERAGDSASYRETLSPLHGWKNLIPTRELAPRAQRLLNLVWTLGLVWYVVVAVRVVRSFRLSY